MLQEFIEKYKIERRERKDYFLLKVPVSLLGKFYSASGITPNLEEEIFGSHLIFRIKK